MNKDAYSYENEEKSRIIFLEGELNSQRLCSIIKDIYYYNEIDNEYELLIKEYVREPIKLIINTPGGSAYSCIALMDVIASSETPIHTIALNAFSAGFNILIMGHERFAYPNSTIMYHELQISNFEGELKTLKDEISESCRLQNILKNMIVANTNVKIEELDAIDEAKREWYITSEEALKKGIIDKIIV